jgi:hypothetical protein
MAGTLTGKVTALALAFAFALAVLAFALALRLSVVEVRVWLLRDLGNWLCRVLRLCN